MEENKIGNLILRQAGIDKTFLIDPRTDERISFSKIEEETGTLAEKLRKLGLRKGQRAAVALQNGADAIVAYLGIMRAGGAAVPVNLGWKEQEFSYILDDSKASYLITNETVLQNANVSMGKRPSEDWKSEKIFTLRENENSAVPKELALLLYTSGTTGKPKGVMLTADNLLAETSYIREGHQLTSDDTAMQILPLFHINGFVIGFLTPYTTGETLILPPKFSVSHFWQWIEKYQVRWVSAVPTIISMILSRTPKEYKGARCMRFLRSASAPLPDAVLKEFQDRFQIPIIESFGISEGGSQISTNPVNGPRKVGSAGIAVGNILQAVDDKGNVLPPGEIGEIRVKGDNVFQGYFRKSEETKESLRNGWFYTGDLGYFDTDGYIFLKGRKKELINRAGEKFSPREIDEILYQIPGVELAAAVGVPDKLYNEEVVAYIKPREGAVLTEEDVQNACKGKIADFKIPKKVFFTDDFPKGPSGKIQRLKFVERFLKWQKETGEQLHE